MSQTRRKRKERSQAEEYAEAAMGLDLPEVLEAIEGAALAAEREHELAAERAAEEARRAAEKADEAEAEGADAQAVGKAEVSDEDAEQEAFIASTQEDAVRPDTSFQLKRVVESLLFAADRPLTVANVCQLIGGDIARNEVRQALDALVDEYKDRGIVLHDVAGGYQFRTHPASSEWIQKLIAGKPVRLSRAQLDTLAIVAYRQPITRPEIEDIRGVDSASTLKVLLDRNLVRILGKKEEAGRPILYGTTKDFLEFFNLAELRDLPTLREFHELNDEGMAQVDKLGADIKGVDVGAVAAEVAAERAAEEEAARQAAEAAAEEKRLAREAAKAERQAAKEAAEAAAAGVEVESTGDLEASTSDDAEAPDDGEPRAEAALEDGEPSVQAEVEFEAPGGAEHVAAPSESLDVVDEIDSDLALAAEAASDDLEDESEDVDAWASEREVEDSDELEASAEAEADDSDELEASAEARAELQDEDDAAEELDGAQESEGAEAMEARFDGGDAREDNEVESTRVDTLPQNGASSDEPMTDTMIEPLVDPYREAPDIDPTLDDKLFRERADTLQEMGDPRDGHTPENTLADVDLDADTDEKTRVDPDPGEHAQLAHDEDEATPPPGS